jgi:hypothetical protein
MINEIFEFLESHPELSIEDTVILYFDRIIWSLEKDEFERVSQEQREQFYQALKRGAKRHP